MSWLAAAGCAGSGMELSAPELNRSLRDMPARRAAASDGSIPSSLDDPREFMLSSGVDRAPECALAFPPPA
jgi:hypothetical protein